MASSRDILFNIAMRAPAALIKRFYGWGGWLIWGPDRHWRQPQSALSGRCDTTRPLSLRFLYLLNPTTSFYFSYFTNKAFLFTDSPPSTDKKSFCTIFQRFARFFFQRFSLSPAQFFIIVLGLDLTVALSPGFFLCPFEKILGKFGTYLIISSIHEILIKILNRKLKTNSFFFY